MTKTKISGFFTLTPFLPVDFAFRASIRPLQWFRASIPGFSEYLYRQCDIFSHELTIMEYVYGMPSFSYCFHEKAC